MRLEFTYSPDDLAEMQRAIANLQQPARYRRFMGIPASVFGWVLFVGLAIFFFVMLQSKNRAGADVRLPQRDTQFNWISLGVPAALVLGAMVLRIWAKWYGSPKKTWERSPALHQPQVLEVSDAGLTISSPLTSTTWSWHAFGQLVESDHLFLAKVTDEGNFLIIPKRAATGETEVGALRSILQSRINSPTQAFPVLMKKPGQ